MGTYYHVAFNQNEWFDLILLLGYVIVYWLPKRFPVLVSCVFILFGIAAGLFMDHAISLAPIDFYDVNDSSTYTIFDFILYCGYGPFSYMAVYFFDRFKLKKPHMLMYIPACCLTAVCFEWLAARLQVFHYKNGYQIIYSFPIYLIVFSILFALYFRLVQKPEEN